MFSDGEEPARAPRGKLGTVFESFTDRGRRVLVLAQEEARLLDHRFIGTEHLLLGLLHEGDGLAAKTLMSLGVALDAARRAVNERTGLLPSGAPGSPPFTPEAKASRDNYASTRCCGRATSGRGPRTAWGRAAVWAHRSPLLSAST
jgi:hypothetical protein